MQNPLEAAVSLPVTAEEAWSEVEREMGVRARIYEKWVNDRKLAWADARDRYARIAFAATLLRTILSLPEQDQALIVTTATKAHARSFAAAGAE